MPTPNTTTDTPCEQLLAALRFVVETTERGDDITNGDLLLFGQIINNAKAAGIRSVKLPTLSL